MHHSWNGNLEKSSNIILYIFWMAFALGEEIPGKELNNLFSNLRHFLKLDPFRERFSEFETFCSLSLHRITSFKFETKWKRNHGVFSFTN